MFKKAGYWHFTLIVASLVVLCLVSNCNGGGGGGSQPGDLLWGRTTNPTTTIAADTALAIALDASAAYVVGYDETPGPGDAQWRVQKMNLTTGSVIGSFGPGGFLTENPSPNLDVVTAIAIDSTAMYLAGYDGVNGPSNLQWRIEKRLLTDGSLVNTFGNGGVVTSPATGGPGLAMARGIAIDSTGIYVVGLDTVSGNFRWRIEKRALTDGALIYQVLGGAGSNSQARSIAIDSAAMYVVGFDNDTVPGNSQWRIEKRLLTDGSLVTAFDGDGIVTSDPGVSAEALSIAIDSTAMYVVGSDWSSGDNQWRIEKRDLTDGSLVAAFGVNGIVISNPSSSNEQSWAVALDSNALYLVGTDSTNPLDSQWRIEKRELSTGALISTFGTNGVVLQDPSNSHDYALSAAIDSNAVYILGFDGSPGSGNWQWRIEKRLK